MWTTYPSAEVTATGDVRRINGVSYTKQCTVWGPWCCHATSAGSILLISSISSLCRCNSCRTTTTLSSLTTRRCTCFSFSCVSSPTVANQTITTSDISY